VHGTGGGGAVTAGQIGRRRSVLQQRFEYGVWPTRHRQHLIQDHYRSGRGFHAHRTDAIAAGGNRKSLGVAIDRTGSNAHTAGVARSQRHSSGVTGDFTSRIAGRFAEVTRRLARSELQRKIEVSCR
jgi:hypothetical protein